jgi:hypothetical protein
MASAEEVSGLNAPSLDAEPARAAEAVTLIDGQPVVGARRTLWLALQSRAFQVFSMICTFYALFAPDVCYGFLPAKADTAILSVGLSIVFFFFIAEGVATLVARPRSACELFFYLDVIATLSLVAVRARASAAASATLLCRRLAHRRLDHPLARRTYCGSRRLLQATRRRS